MMMLLFCGGRLFQVRKYWCLSKNLYRHFLFLQLKVHSCTLKNMHLMKIIQNVYWDEIVCKGFLHQRYRIFCKYFAVSCRIFPSIFYCHYSVVKTQSKIEFQTQFSILFTSITHISLQLSNFFSLYIIHYESTSKKDIFLVLFLRKYVFQQSLGFQITNFLQPFMGHHAGCFECHYKINRNHKTQSSKQRPW